MFTDMPYITDIGNLLELGKHVITDDQLFVLVLLVGVLATAAHEDLLPRENLVDPERLPLVRIRDNPPVPLLWPFSLCVLDRIVHLLPSW